MNGRRIRAGQDITYRDRTGWQQMARVASSFLQCPTCGAAILLMDNQDWVDPTRLSVHQCPEA